MNNQPTDKNTGQEVSVELNRNEPGQEEAQVLSTAKHEPEIISPQVVTGEPETPWKFSDSTGSAASENNVPETTSPPIVQPVVTQQPASWSASEFIHHKKSLGWYSLLILIGIGITAGVYFLDHRSIFSTVIVGVAILALAVYANRQPRILKYSLNHDGLTIDDKHYKYDQFRSFAITSEGAFTSIVLTPLKRFMPQLSIIFPPEEQAKITDILADSLPMEEHKPDAIDSLMHRIRF